MQIPTVKVKDKAGNDVIVNEEDAHLYDEFKKPTKKVEAKNSKKADK
jgi:hypothetical protein